MKEKEAESSNQEGKTGQEGRQQERFTSPLKLGLIAVGVIFVAEFFIMHYLRWLLEEAGKRSHILESLLDATLVSLIAAVAIGLLLVRPLERALGILSRHSRRLRNELDVAEAKYEAVFKQSFEYMGILDPEGRFEEVSENALRAGGVGLEEVRGRPIWETVWWRGMEEEQRKLREAVEQARQGKASAFELWFRMGEERRCVAFSLKPVAGRGGKVEFLLAEGRDITRLKRTEERLRLLARAVESTSDAVVITDLEGTILEVNPAFTEITGYRPEEAIGKNPRILKSGKQPPEFYRQMWDTLLSGKTWQGRVINRRKDGSLYHASLTISPISNERGERMGYVGVQRDVTQEVEHLEELKRLNHELELAHREAEAAAEAKARFLANMSHEIRTPLNGVLGMAELLARTELTPEQRDYLETLRESGRTLLELINDILDFSKLEEGKVELEEIPFNLHQLCYRTVRIFSGQAQEKGLELICSLGPEVPIGVRGDPTRLKQVLINLLGNAIKFTDEGEVRLEVRELERREGLSRLEFGVVDTGIGIAQDKLEQIFETFTQADSSVSRRYGGTGLGLAISRKIVELMGGELRVESREGEGTRFFFQVELPLAEVAEMEIPELPEEIAELPVMIVDDNATNRRILEGYMESWGMREIVSLPSGEEALSYLAGLTRRGRPLPKLIITDANMPGLSGPEWIERARAEFDLGDTRVLLLTSSMALKREEQERLGIDAVVFKPVMPEKLYRYILKLTGHLEGEAEEEEEPGEKRAPIAPEARVLVVEDNPVNLRVAASLLGQLGLRNISTAGDGRQAVELVKAGQFDLILMDVQMPGMDGLEATRQIRRYEEQTGRPRVPIVALTAHALPGDRERFLEAGMDDYLTKPIDPRELEQTLSRWLSAPARASAGNGAGVEREAVAADPAPPGGDGGAEEPPVEKEELLRRMGGDRGLVAEVVKVFLDTYPDLLAELSLAAAEREGERLWQTAHSLKGSLANLAARGASELAAEIERLARQGELDRAAGLVPRLREMVERVADVLREETERVG